MREEKEIEVISIIGGWKKKKYKDRKRYKVNRKIEVRVLDDNKIYTPLKKYTKYRKRSLKTCQPSPWGNS